MSQSARVESIEALKEFRVSLCLFVEAVQMGLSEAESDIQRAGLWVQQDCPGYWKPEARRRQELLIRARIALNQKRHSKTPLGGRPSCVEEEKALAVAERRYEEAEQKLANIKRWTRLLEEEVFNYRGQVHGIAQTVEQEVPNSLAFLDRLMDSLNRYLAAASGPMETALDERTPAREPWRQEDLPSLKRDTPEPPREETKPSKEKQAGTNDVSQASQPTNRSDKPGPEESGQP